jgi:GR25 family glycosyltransferase involved in LPS biosynthesis
MTNSNPSEILIQVINLERRPDRLARISTELQRAELSFETQVAVDGQLETHEPKFISKGAIGCWKSHVNSMRRIVASNVPFGLILEDDATLSPVVNDEFLSEMIEIMKRNQLDILQLGFIEGPYSTSFSSFRAGPIEFLMSLLKGRGTRDSSGVRFVLGEFRIGTHAYLVNERLAQFVSEITPGAPLVPWDDYLGHLAETYIRGDIKIARLVKPIIYQESHRFKYSNPDSDTLT